MANDIIEFATEKETEDLRALAKEIRHAINRAAEGNHKFLAYLLEMAQIEADGLIEERRTRARGPS